MLLPVWWELSLLFAALWFVLWLTGTSPTAPPTEMLCIQLFVRYYFSFQNLGFYKETDKQKNNIYLIISLWNFKKREKLPELLVS